MELLAKCGFRCDLCPAYKENIKTDADRVRVSEGWRRIFGFEFTPENVVCVGCHNEGNHADANCPVRQCTMEKDLPNCAGCDGFGCEALKTRTDFLEDYISKLPDISEEDYQTYLLAYESKTRLMKLRNRKTESQG
ncbi:MAG TPA: DUF3795 domain-containing protein [Bacillota bacterium]